MCQPMTRPLPPHVALRPCSNTLPPRSTCRLHPELRVLWWRTLCPPLVAAIHRAISRRCLLACALVVCLSTDSKANVDDDAVTQSVEDYWGGQSSYVCMYRSPAPCVASPSFTQASKRVGHEPADAAGGAAGSKLPPKLSRRTCLAVSAACQCAPAYFVHTAAVPFQAQQEHMQQFNALSQRLQSLEKLVRDSTAPSPVGL